MADFQIPDLNDDQEETPGPGGAAQGQDQSDLLAALQAYQGSQAGGPTPASHIVAQLPPAVPAVVPGAGQPAGPPPPGMGIVDPFAPSSPPAGPSGSPGHLAPAVPTAQFGPDGKPTGPMQPQDPYNPTNIGQGGFQPDPVKRADMAQDQALTADASAEGQAMDAQLKANQDTATKRAQVAQDYAKGLGEEATAFAHAREAAHQEAAAETADWMKQLDQKAKEEPNPHRWWDNTSGFGKALWLLSLAFGTAGAAKQPGAKNIAIEMIDREVDSDVQRQKERLTREIEALKTKGTKMDKDQAQKLADLTDDHSLRVGKLNALQIAGDLKAQVPGDAQAQANWAMARQHLEERKLGVATTRYTQAVQAREAQLTRDSENYRAQLTDKKDRDLKALEIQKDYDLANLSAGVKLASDKAAAKGDIGGVHPDTGMILTKPDGSPIGDGIVRASNKEKARENLAGVATTGNKTYNALMTIQEHLKDDSFGALLMKRDPQLMGAINDIGYSNAKADDPQGRVNDADRLNGIVQAVGYDPTTFVGATQLAANKSKVIDMIDTELGSLHRRVENEANKYNDPDVNGANSHISWSPKRLRVETPKAPSVNDSLAAAGAAPTLAAVTSTDDYRKGKKLEDSNPEFAGQVLPQHDRAKVEEARSAFANRIPDVIEILARKALADVPGDKDPWDATKRLSKPLDDVTKKGIEAAAEDAKARSGQALQDLKTRMYEHLLGGIPDNSSEVEDLALKKYQLQLSPQQVDELVKEVDAKFKKAKEN